MYVCFIARRQRHLAGGRIHVVVESSQLFSGFIWKPVVVRT